MSAPQNARSHLRRATRAIELRNRLRQASIIIQTKTSSASARLNYDFWARNKQYISGAVGALIGGICVFTATLLLNNSETANSKEVNTGKSIFKSADQSPAEQAEQLIKLLTRIADKGSSKVDYEGIKAPSSYEQCLEECARHFPVGNESDKALLINCRNECISLYSQRVKEMQKLYFQDQH